MKDKDDKASLICGFCGKPVCKDETGRYADCSGYDLRYSR